MLVIFINNLGVVEDVAQMEKIPSTQILGLEALQIVSTVLRAHLRSHLLIPLLLLDLSEEVRLGHQDLDEAQ